MYERDLASALATMARRRGSRGFTFDDLAGVGHRYRATIGSVADWLSRARSTGLVEELGFDRGLGGPDALGPRRYRIAQARSTAAEGDAVQEASA
jgi:hypothetical protein